MVRRLALALGLFSGCLNGSAPELAPEAVDANLRWFWVHGDEADDATLADGAEKLALGAKADTRTAPLKGQMRMRLEPSDLASVGLEGNDPSTARGLLVVNLFECSLDRLEALVAAKDQEALYDGVYRSYERTYTSDAQAFAERQSDRLTWTVKSSSALPIEDVYESTLNGGLRRVRASAQSATKGDFLIARTYLTQPATFANPSGSHFTQDYQIEVYWQQSPGRIFHAYGMWRDIKAGGFNLSIEDNGFMNIVLDNLVDWDTKTAQLCAK